MVKKILSLVFVVGLFAGVQAQSENAIANIIQPTRSWDGSKISYTDNVYTLPRWAKAVELKTGSTAGYIEVHLVKDGASTWYKMPLTAGNRNAALFDKVRSTGTSVVKDSCVLFLIETY